jgi:hypothetical protein
MSTLLKNYINPSKMREMVEKTKIEKGFNDVDPAN